ncbi:maternal protein exuperantia-like [Saccostrea echinata]|uniref:maternal protein exuperantia-like n=1 Tax=Saccostrea echinata TaxID=191078 RepID=UPI002A7F1FB1|nr:maternal protein exuperantia-like [Saccostrea echinata]
MRKRHSNAEKYCTKEFKRRRVQLKKSASNAASSSETREGVTYRSGVLSTTSSIPDSDMETIPPPPQHLQQNPLPPCQYSRVYFDLETTGLGLSADIVQLAARCGETEFNQYVLPTVNINPMASKITGLTYDGTLLYKNGAALPAVSIEMCLSSFFDWLNTSGLKHPVLFAHNARKFDSLIFGRSVLDSGKEEQGRIICGFCDTLPILKEHASGSHLNFSLETLVKDILGCSFSAHDAVEDCRYLQKVVEHHNIDSFYLQYSFTLMYILDIIKQMETSKKKSTNSYAIS